MSALGAGSALFGACSPTNNPIDSGVDAPVCNPDSGDPAGCACDPTSVKPADCYTGPPGTSSRGICQPGKRSCTPQGKYTACVGEITPQPETCNLADDDCNGQIDDLFNDAAVVAHCNSPACSPSFMDAAITCWGPDPGICGAGTKTCAPGPKGGTPTGCDEFIHTPAQEICNGIDDDCNGTIDDGLDQEGPCDMDDGSVWPDDANPLLEGGVDGGKVTQILGECVHGNLTCVASNCDEHSCKDAGDRCFPKQPLTETCNGKDDNCNGAIDEGSCLTYPTGYNWCCAYQNNTYAYCNTTNLGDGGNGQFYNCHYAR